MAALVSGEAALHRIQGRRSPRQRIRRCTPSSSPLTPEVSGVQPYSAHLPMESTNRTVTGPALWSASGYTASRHPAPHPYRDHSEAGHPHSAGTQYVFFVTTVGNPQTGPSLGLCESGTYPGGSFFVSFDANGFTTTWGSAGDLDLAFRAVFAVQK